MNFLKKQSPVRIISLGFALVILIGSVLLSLPCSIRDGVTLRYIDALYMSTSAVCVTGLLTVDAGDTFTPLGQFFLGMLIQELARLGDRQTRCIRLYDLKKEIRERGKR